MTVAPEPDEPEPPASSTPTNAVGPMCTVAEDWWFSICLAIAIAVFTGTAKPSFPAELNE